MTPPDSIGASADSAPSHPIGYRLKGDRWTPIRSDQCDIHVQRLCEALLEAGAKPGDVACSLLPNNYELMVCDFAMTRLGLAPMILPEKMSAGLAQRVFQELSVSFVFSRSAAALTVLPSTAWKSIKAVLLLDPPPSSLPARTFYWNEVMATPPKMNRPGPLPAESGLSYFFSAGTTGEPRIVVHERQRVVAGGRAFLRDFSILNVSNERAVTWMPATNLFQRLAVSLALSAGTPIFFIEDPGSVLRHLRSIEPYYFFGIPRFFEQTAKGILRDRLAAPWPVRWGFHWGLRLQPSSAKARKNALLRWWRNSLDRLFFRKLRENLFGRRIRFMLTGVDSMPAWLLTFFDRLGVLILEGYGCVECSTPITLNRPDSVRFGSVGKPLTSVSIRLSQEGEILVKSPSLFTGYLGNPKPNKGVFTPEGELKTGDLGRFDGDGFLYILGRKEEMVRLSSGRRVSPVVVENRYRESPLIDQIVVFGEGQPAPIALVYLDPATVQLSLTRRGRSASDPVHTSNEARRLVLADFERLDKGHPQEERVRRFALLGKPLSIEQNELTFSLKYRRKVIQKHYQDVLDSLTKPQA